MTSEDILRRKRGLEEDERDTESGGIGESTARICIWLAEIAYQLAKANERNEAKA